MSTSGIYTQENMQDTSLDKPNILIINCKHVGLFKRDISHILYLIRIPLIFWGQTCL